MPWYRHFAWCFPMCSGGQIPRNVMNPSRTCSRLYFVPRHGRVWSYIRLHLQPIFRPSICAKFGAGPIDLAPSLHLLVKSVLSTSQVGRPAVFFYTSSHKDGSYALGGEGKGKKKKGPHTRRRGGDTAKCYGKIRALAWRPKQRDMGSRKKMGKQLLTTPEEEVPSQHLFPSSATTRTTQRMCHTIAATCACQPSLPIPYPESWSSARVADTAEIGTWVRLDSW